MAEVPTPIIGMDFLSHYGLLVDPRDKKGLLDTTTQLTSRGYAASNNMPSLKTICGDSAYHQLLAEFPTSPFRQTIGRERPDTAWCITSKPHQADQFTIRFAALHETDSDK